MTLADLLDVINESTLIDIVDANTGESIFSGDVSDAIAEDFEEDSRLGELFDCEVMDMNVWNNTLTICIDNE